MLPAIGSVSTLVGQGRSGVVVSAQPIGEAENGRQLVALKVRESADNPRYGRLEDAPRDDRPKDARDRSLPAGRIDPLQPNDRPSASATAARLPADLSAAEKADVTRLQQRDQQVRQEEKAHAAVAGDLAGPISYTYQRGPDGRQYAVGGSVGLQATVLSGDPAEASRKAGRMAAAAHAATSPSAQDYAAARDAYALGSRLSPPSPLHERAEGLRLFV